LSAGLEAAALRQARTPAATTVWSHIFIKFISLDGINVNVIQLFLSTK
jgi:hypothetical protein